MNRWPQKTTSMGRCTRAAQSAAREICEPALHGTKLPNAGRQRTQRRSACARQDDHIADPIACRERGQEITVVLGNSAASAECIGHQRENSERRLDHHAPAQAAAT